LKNAKDDICYVINTGSNGNNPPNPINYFNPEEERSNKRKVMLKKYFKING
jgi:hypothetical protein